MAIAPNAQQSPVSQATASAEPRSGSLADVLDVILDKGLVIDAFVRVSLVGIEILTLDARIVVASVETYMYFAREAHRLEMGGGQGSAKQGLGGMMGKLAEGGAHNIARGALQGAGEGLREGLLPSSHRNEPQERRGVVQRAVGAIKDKAADSIREAFSPGDEEHGNQENEGRPEDSGPSAPAGSQAPRRSRRRPGASADQSGSHRAEATSQGGQGSPGAGSGRRAAPSSRRAPSRGEASE